MVILTAAQLREIDRLSTERSGVPSILLMEQAAMRVVEALEARFKNLPRKNVVILCGKGNNGGDGMAIARQLLRMGCQPRVFLFAPEAEVRGDARTNLKMLEAVGRAPQVVLNEAEWESVKSLWPQQADIVVDALFGTGINKPVEGLLGTVIGDLRFDFSGAAIVSVDIPSGLPADASHPIGPAVRADITVTFTALKPALVLGPNCGYAGEVITVDIGAVMVHGSPGCRMFLIGPDMLSVAQRTRDDRSGVSVDPSSPEYLQAIVKGRPARFGHGYAANKGDYGKVLVIAGSRGKSGAAVMAGQAALRSGAGLVMVATPVGIAATVAASMPELMTEGLPETTAGVVAAGAVANLLRGKTVAAVGPGLGLTAETRQFVHTLLDEATIPLIVDADGLNAFVDDPDRLRGRPERPVVITPHPGEMARLIGRGTPYVQENRVDVAREFATKHGVIVVLKGYRTVIAMPGSSDFRDACVLINPTGNPGMATAGTGDILTGMIAGILAQDHLGTLSERLCLAVYLHGLAGDLAASDLGEEAMTATDLLRYLGGAWKHLRAAAVAPRSWLEHFDTADSDI